MSLPSSLLNAVAGHRCFTGCYRSDPVTHVCTDPALPLTPTLQAVCSDCMAFRVGAAVSTLPAGMSSHALADELSAYVRGLRGFVWSTSGYTNAGGFWISAAYYGAGLFLVDASRNGSHSTDLDVLIRAFQLGVVSPEDPRMLVSGLYTSEVVYLDMTQPIIPVRGKADLLASPQCRSTRAQGFQRATILEFVPLARNHRVRQNPLAFAPPVQAAPGQTAQVGQAAQAAPPTRPSNRPGARASAAAVNASSAAPPVLGENVCPKCGAEIKERPLFSGTFVGCMC